MKIKLGQFGSLKKNDDHFLGTGLPTDIGPVNVQIDGIEFAVAPMEAAIVTALDRIKYIDAEARAYLDAKAPEDVQAAGALIDPSLLFMTDEDFGTFVVFYSSSDPDDETCYGVDFHDFRPFDLVIGD